eukprot:scaffold1041_cov124-Isochrysis_galbana.AAC.17
MLGTRVCGGAAGIEGLVRYTLGRRRTFSAAASMEDGVGGWGAEHPKRALGTADEDVRPGHLPDARLAAARQQPSLLPLVSQVVVMREGQPTHHPGGDAALSRGGSGVSQPHDSAGVAHPRGEDAPWVDDHRCGSRATFLRQVQQHLLANLGFELGLLRHEPHRNLLLIPLLDGALQRAEFGVHCRYQRLVLLHQRPLRGDARGVRCLRPRRSSDCSRRLADCTHQRGRQMGRRRGGVCASAPDAVHGVPVEYPERQAVLPARRHVHRISVLVLARNSSSLRSVLHLEHRFIGGKMQPGGTRTAPRTYREGAKPTLQLRAPGLVFALVPPVLRRARIR